MGQDNRRERETLDVLFNGGMCTCPSLARRFQITYERMLQVLRQMRRKGWISRESDYRGRAPRGHLWRLTVRGTDEWGAWRKREAEKEAKARAR